MKGQIISCTLGETCGEFCQADLEIMYHIVFQDLVPTSDENEIRKALSLVLDWAAMVCIFW